MNIRQKIQLTLLWERLSKWPMEQKQMGGMGILIQEWTNLKYIYF